MVALDLGHGHEPALGLGDATTVHELVGVGWTLVDALGVVYHELATDFAVVGRLARAAAQARPVTTLAGVGAGTAVLAVADWKFKFVC